jgi:hypothetical protein
MVCFERRFAPELNLQTTRLDPISGRADLDLT